MNRRTFVVAALAWVFVVTLGSGLVWAVISRAGDGVVSTAAPDRTDDAPLIGEATQTVGDPTGDASHHPSGDDNGGQDGKGDDDHGDDHGGHGSGGDDGPGDQPTGDGRATSRPSGGGSSGGSSGGSGGSGGTKTSNPSPDAPDPVTRIWDGAAGTVKVECTGSTIRLLSAYPHDGYRFEVGDNGPEHVEVEFENTSTERHTKVESSCSQGTPVFRVETESESDDD